jgi:hypothetical protein
MWKLVQRGAPDDCWYWWGYVGNTGYPVHGSGYPCRIALKEKLGRPIRRGMFACHTCDEPTCCNPAHLYEGTPAQNSADMVARGRYRGGRAKGVPNGNSHCPQGHPYAGDNLIITKQGWRRCRACKYGWTLPS